MFDSPKSKLLPMAGRLITGMLLLAFGAGSVPSQAASPRKAVVALARDAGLGGVELADRAKSALDSAGLAVTFIDAAAMCGSVALNAARFRLLVYTDRRMFPAKSAQVLNEFLGDGGSLIVLGGTAFA